MLFHRRVAILFSFLSLLPGCYVGGSLNEDPGPPKVRSAQVDQPQVSFPTSNPYYSKDSILTVRGLCSPDATLSVTGDHTQQLVCQGDLTFEFQVQKTTDGVYTFSISQITSNGAMSLPSPLIWIRKTSVAPPAMITPNISPFPSGSNDLNITGNCENGSVLSLAGSATLSTTCSNSSFNLRVTKIPDADYPFTLTQTDLAGNQASYSFTWKKRALALSPGNTTLVVGTPQTLTPSGGSENYTLSIVQNNSGGSLNLATQTYTTGTLAYVNDTLRVTDSLGITKDILITTAPSTPDHMNIVSGDGQDQNLSTELVTNPKIKVVDAYENGIPAIPVFFQVQGGDVQIIGNPFVTTNSNGEASIRARLGVRRYSRIKVFPVSITLPDSAGTGRSNVSFDLRTTSNGLGPLGLNWGVGLSPAQILNADLNADGKQDIVTLNSGSHNITVMLGDGTGQFGSKQTIPLGGCTTPQRGVIADLVGTSALDLAVICTGSDAIFILSGDGTGGFSVSTNFAISAGGTSLLAQDVDSNGKTDLLVTTTSDQKLSIFYQESNGTFTTPAGSALITTGAFPTSVVALDYDKDSKLDLAVSNSGNNNVSVFRNLGSRSFTTGTTYQTSSAPQLLFAVDLNQDNFLDLFTLNTPSNSATTLLNDQSGAFLDNNSNTPDLVLDSGSSWGTFADLNQDSKLDLAVTVDGSSQIAVFPGATAGTFGAAVRYDTLPNPSGVVAFDSNQDSRSDLLILSTGEAQFQNLLSNPNQGFGLESDVGTNPGAHYLGDFNEDGKLDVVVLNNASNNFTLLSGVGNGLFQFVRHVSTGAASTPTDAVIEDFNKDGHLDLVVVNNNLGSVGFFKGLGNGNFDPVVTSAISGSRPTNIISRDFNNDGNLDIATSNSGSASVSVLLNDGSAGFTLKGTYTTGISPNDLASADFNNDGFLDIATANNGDLNYSILLGNGDGTLRAALNSDAFGASLDSIVETDLNADGKIDLVISANGDGSVYSFLGVGDGSFTSRGAFSAGSNPGKIRLGDFNKDGRVDLAVQNTGTSYAFQILMGLGNGNFNSASPYLTGFTVGSICVGDVNGDNALDVLVTNRDEGILKVWMGQK